MSNQKREFTDEELDIVDRMEDVMSELKSHPEITCMRLSDNLHRELWRDIREFKVEKAEAASVAPEPVQKEAEPEVPRLSKEEQELIQLGKIYKRKQKNKKFYLLIAAVVCAMAFGVTSMGEPERIFERFGFKTFDREQEHINSNGDVRLDTKAAEEEAYQQIEDEYGVWPVQFGYLPDGVEYDKSISFDETQILQLNYGQDGKIYISYLIRPGYRDGSWGMDIEDKLIEEYSQEVQNVKIQIKKFQVEETKTYRWTAEYSYKDMQYYLVIRDLTEEEFDEIINNLKFL